MNTIEDEEVLFEDRADSPNCHKFGPDGNPWSIVHNAVEEVWEEVGGKLKQICEDSVSRHLESEYQSLVAKNRYLEMMSRTWEKDKKYLLGRIEKVSSERDLLGDENRNLCRSLALKFRLRLIAAIGISVVSCAVGVGIGWLVF